MLPLGCSAVIAVALGLMHTSTGPAKLTGGLILLGALAGGIWISNEARFVAVAPAVGLALALLILIGLVLAAVHELNATVLAVAIGAVTLVAAWGGSLRPRARVRERTPSVKPPHPLAVGGVVILVAAAAFAVHYSAGSAASNSDQASSLAVWAYPSGTQLQVGAEQPPGHGSVSVRIVVTHAGITAAAWNHVRLAPGQAWKAPPLTVIGNGPTQVVASQDARVLARLSVVPPHQTAVARPGAIQKPSPPRPGRS